MATDSAAPVFQFSPRWGEFLVVQGPGGSFALDHPMGIPSVYLPTEEEYRQKAPSWAVDLWDVLRDELEQYCRKYDYRFRIERGATLYAQGPRR